MTDFSSSRRASAGSEPAYSPPPGVHVTDYQSLVRNGSRTVPWAALQESFFGEDGRSLRLYCAGDESLIARPCVAIVGTRDASSMGAARARRLARELVAAGVVVMSGLAKGIDTEALTAAIEAGGRVVAVIGTPVDKAYPAENKRLQERIYHDHLLISQFPSGGRVFQSNFPVRNRLMAALSDATAIVEAGETSGTLHQATACLKYERWLFIARNVVDNPNLRWPGRFVGKPRTRVLSTTDDVLTVLSLNPEAR